MRLTITRVWYTINIMGSTDLLTSVDRGPLRGLINDQLRELIISGQAAPGDRLVESDLAERLGTSRVPVREALLELSKEGWVDLRPRQGARVHRPTEREVTEVFQVRAALEAETARLAARSIAQDELDLLRSINERGAGFARSGDHAAAARANAELHRTIAHCSGNHLLTRILGNLEHRIRWYFTRIAPTRGMNSWDEHERIIDAIAQGDAARAVARMQAHTETTQETYKLRFAVAEPEG